MHKKWFFSNSLQRYTVTTNTIFVCTKCIIFITTTGNVQLCTRFVTYIVPFVCKSLKLFIECLTFGNILVPYTIVKITIFWSNNYVYIFKIIIQDRDSNDENATYSEMIHNQCNKKNEYIDTTRITHHSQSFHWYLSSNSITVQLRKNRWFGNLFTRHYSAVLYDSIILLNLIVDTIKNEYVFINFLLCTSNPESFLSIFRDGGFYTILG